MMQLHQESDTGPAGDWKAFMADVLDLTAALLYARWRRAVDLLWREAVRRRESGVAERERARRVKRVKNLQKIVRKALSDYHRIELERQGRRSPVSRVPDPK
jgi:hypothetical protein